MEMLAAKTGDSILTLKDVLGTYMLNGVPVRANISAGTTMYVEAIDPTNGQLWCSRTASGRKTSGWYDRADVGLRPLR